MDLTIQDLANKVEMTPRNIREWQTIGVLPPPHRRGRLGFYDGSHVARIERIKSLRAEGFPLDVIRQFLDRSEGSAAEVQALAANLLDTASPTGTLTMGRAELAERFGADAEGHLVECKLLEVLDDDHVLIKDVATLDYVEKLAAVGLSVEAIAVALEAMTRHQMLGVTAMVELYRDGIWQPFVEAGLPADQWPSIAVTSGQMRELVIALSGHTLRRATDAVIGQVAVEQATILDSRQADNDA